MSASAPHRIVVLGGGITGLAAAHAAIGRARALGRAVAVTVVERTPRFGGNLITDRVEGFLLDAGPDSWVVNKPHASALAKELGLGGAIVGTNEAMRRYFIVWNGRLHHVPEGLVLGVPTRLLPLARTSLFSWLGKARMAFEPFVATRRFEDETDDESIGDFAARRLGREAAERLVAPLLGGISAGDANELSVRASFPQLVAMEREHGSLVRGMRAAKRARAESEAKTRRANGANGAGRGPSREGSAFASLEGGVGDLVRALQSRLLADGAVLRSSTEATAITRGTGGASPWTVQVAGGDSLDADALVVAMPAAAAARLLGSVDGEVTRALGTIDYGSTATVFLGYRRADVKHPLDGVGFVVPRTLGRPLLAGTWVSSKWAGRAPEGHVLLRAFVGGPSAASALAGPDASLVRIARDELEALMGLDAEPVLSRVYRFPIGSAQMRVGHLPRMRAMRERLARVAPGLRIVGGGYDGVGIPDCVRQGQEAGRELAESTGS